MTQEEKLQGNILILNYLYQNKRIDYSDYNLVNLTLSGYRYDLSWDKLHIVIDQINGLGK